VIYMGNIDYALTYSPYVFKIFILFDIQGKSLHLQIQPGNPYQVIIEYGLLFLLFPLLSGGHWWTKGLTEHHPESCCQ